MTYEFLKVIDPVHGEVLRITNKAVTVNPILSADENALAVLSALRVYVDAADKARLDEIERLRAALEEIVILSDDYHKAVPIARAALAPPKQEEAND